MLCTCKFYNIPILQIWRCYAPSNITRLCRSEYQVTLLLQILRCSAPVNAIIFRCYKYYGAMHLQILRGSAATNITRLCRNKYYATLPLPVQSTGILNCPDLFVNWIRCYEWSGNMTTISFLMKKHLFGNRLRLIIIYNCSESKRLTTCFFKKPDQ